MPKKLIIQGDQELSGKIKISGAKNSATKLMIASLLTEEEVRLDNVPHIGDVDITAEICKAVGAQIKKGKHTLMLSTPKITNTKVTEQTSKNRLSVLAIPALLHRAGEAELPVVGGDKIGARPVNYHIEALQKMGAKIKETAEGYSAHTDGLRGADIWLEYPSVGATESVILAGVLAKGRTVIHNAATEPEVSELIMMLQKMGAIVEPRAHQVIIIDGVRKLNGAEHTVMADRLEAAAYALLGIATGGEVFVEGARHAHLMPLLNSLHKIGAGFKVHETGIRFSRDSEKLHAAEITTDVWPGFSTDWQQPMAVLLTQAHGQSIINETVYENRFEYTKTLNRMGADIKVFDVREKQKSKKFRGSFYNQSAKIIGPTPLRGTKITIPDIRAGMAQLIAAFIAKGESEITGIEHLLRGYDELLTKLRSLGAKFSVK